MFQNKGKRARHTEKEVSDHIEKRKRQFGKIIKGFIIFMGILCALYFCQLAYAIVWVSTDGNAVASTAAAVIFGAGELAFLIAYYRIIRPFLRRKWNALVGKLRGI